MLHLSLITLSSNSIIIVQCHVRLTMIGHTCILLTYTISPVTDPVPSSSVVNDMSDSTHNLPLIIGLVVGLVGLLIVSVLIVIIVLRVVLVRQCKCSAFTEEPFYD